jgi:hypothetical protein
MIFERQAFKCGEPFISNDSKLRTFFVEHKLQVKNKPTVQHEELPCRKGPRKG